MKPAIDNYDTDILIIGAGGAGLFAALHAHKASSEGTRITIAVKGLPGKCGCTRMVQGGYNVALGKGDSVERHFMDTIIGGKWLPDQDIAWRLCEQAVVRIQELENEIGCFFDRSSDGTLHHKAFAGQTADRTVHKGDLTGIEIINRLMEQVLARNIECMAEHRAIGLIPDVTGTAISGVLMMDMRRGTLRFVRAKSVLLATGGGPTMYKYHTPSGDKSMDGLAMALRVGVALRDMEMIQFHPTGLLAGDDTRMTGTVLEEGLRGAGGHLLNGDHYRFMFDYDPKGERATRDIVSRAIYAQMQLGKTSKYGGVYIAMSHLGVENVAKKFPGMVKRCADCGFDLAGGLVEVVPTAHYAMGGAIVDIDTKSALHGLFIAGEDAGGAHGSNRLGGNGVANSTVYGGIAGDEMAKFVNTQKTHRDPDRNILENEIARCIHPLQKPARPLGPLRKKLQNVMWDDVGVIRNEQGLLRGVQSIEDITNELDETGVDAGNLAFNLTWHDWLNLQSLCAVSKTIAKAALVRKNSRGAHYHDGYPTQGDLHKSDFTVTKLVDGQANITTQPVKFTIVKPGESLLPSDAPATLTKV